MSKEMLTGPAEQHLVRLINTGDSAVFSQLYQQYWSSLLDFAENYIPDSDTCKEIVQQLFITLYVKGSHLNIHASLRSYLYSSLRNKIFNHLRNRSTYIRHIRGASRANAPECGDNQVEEFIDVRELKTKINSCLERMPVKCREVYVLHKQQQYTLKRTSEILQRPVDTVEKQLRRAIHLLRDYLSEQ
jgi:RNA polymerase sigma factor (sigma-70 family)